MLGALVADLLAVQEDPAWELRVCMDRRITVDFKHERVRRVALDATSSFWSAWEAELANCDAAWPIGPETGGILERLCLAVESSGAILLGNPSSAVRLARSKQATARRLAACGVPVVETLPLAGHERPAAPAWVVKPDDGVGCENTLIVPDPARFQMQAHMADWIVQPRLEGEALSLSALFAHGQARLLCVNRQLIRQQNDGYALTACRVNNLEDTDRRWQALAAQVASAMPELWGYAGIDLILTAAGPVVLEINPRLTTSYAGISQATGENPAAMVWKLRKTGKLPPMRSRHGAAVEIALENDVED